MALTSTIHTFNIELADSDRGVYETLDLRVARHPSETEEHLVTRLLAYCLAYTPGIAFSKGLADVSDPAIAVRDLTGTLEVWIDIGAPDAARLHRASKAAPQVVVYTHKNPALLLRQWAGKRIHRAETLELYSFDQSLIADLVARLERRMNLVVSMADGHLYVTIGDEALGGAVERHHVSAA